MDGGKKRSRGGGGCFGEILYEVVDDVSTDSTISWSQSGKSFVVWNESEFIRDLLPRFFEDRDMSSFLYCLHSYGFTKLAQCEYAHARFVRGKRELATTPGSLLLSPRSPEFLAIIEARKQRLLSVENIRNKRMLSQGLHHLSLN